jgi:hypothetical protein
VIAFDSICDNEADADSTVELFRTCEDVDHGAIVGAYVGVSTVGQCFKERVFYSMFVGKIESQKVRATNIATGGSMWAEDSC